MHQRMISSLIDFLSSSGGIFMALFTICKPVGSLFSAFYFKLGVIGLLFKARSFRNEPIQKQPKDKWQDPKALKAARLGKNARYQALHLDEWQKFTLFFATIGMFKIILAAICCSMVSQGGDDAQEEGGEQDEDTYENLEK